jgi:thiol-disulfide isomerase/thioredoxin
MKRGIYIFWIIIAVLIVAGIGMSFYKTTSTSGPGQYDTLAQCLKDKGVIFYGAYWCPHCQATKKEFGSSAHLLPYVECSTPDGQSQQKVCTDAGVTSYPTWVFADGSRLTGEHTVQELAKAAGCPIPTQ